MGSVRNPGNTDIERNTRGEGMSSVDDRTGARMCSGGIYRVGGQAVMVIVMLSVDGG